MHDINSTRLETSQGYNTYGEYQESEAYEGEAGFEMPITETEEEALAAELLSVSSEEEMDQFLGGLFRKIKRGLSGAARFLNQNAGPLAGALKGLAGKALPFVGGALGTAIPIPGVGTALGSALGQAASNFLQSETESLEFDEQETEMARRYVRLASQAIRQASRIPPRGNPYRAANFALRTALRRLRAAGGGGFRPRPMYVGYGPYSPYPVSEPCPPCPVCPTCAQVLPTPDTSQQPQQPLPTTDTSPQVGAGGGAATSAAAGGEPPSSEFAFEDTGEFGGVGEGEEEGEADGEGESEYYETDNEFLAAPGTGAGRSGRWVRRGRKIILHGL
jgi:hypothetical protein